MQALQVTDLSGPDGVRVMDVPEPTGDGVLLDVRVVRAQFPGICCAARACTRSGSCRHTPWARKSLAWWCAPHRRRSSNWRPCGRHGRRRRGATCVRQPT